MKLFFSLLLLLVSTLAFAESRSNHSVGVGAGTPWVVSAMYEYWPVESPVVIRAHAGTIVFASAGGLDLGISIDNEGDFRQFVGVSGEAAFTFTFGGLGAAAYGCGGPRYGLRYKDFYADLGIGLGGGSESFLGFEAPLSLTVFPMAHFGYAINL